MKPARSGGRPTAAAAAEASGCGAGGDARARDGAARAGATATRPPPPEDDALDLGATVLPVLAKSYWQAVAAGRRVLLVLLICAGCSGEDGADVVAVSGQPWATGSVSDQPSVVAPLPTVTRARTGSPTRLLLTVVADAPLCQQEPGRLVTRLRGVGTAPRSAGRAATLGTACSQVRWHEPPITTRSPWPISNDDRLAAAARPQRQPPRVAERHDRDHRVLRSAAADRVAVPGDAVAAVAVVAAPGGHERLAELGAVVVRERVARLVEQRVGERLALAVGVHQPGTSTTRSYICRRSARHGTSATSRSSTSSAPDTQSRRTSTQAPRVSGWRTAGQARAARGVDGRLEERALEVHAPHRIAPDRTRCSTSESGMSPGSPGPWGPHPGYVGRPWQAGRVSEPAARIRDLVKTYGTGDALVRALDGVSLDLAAGEFTAVMGPSGSGKSTLMHCCAALDRADLGHGVHRRHGARAARRTRR